jgi:AmmeMemoRadiSam system protein A
MEDSSQPFLTEQDKEYLLSLAGISIRNAMDGLPPPDTGGQKYPGCDGVFVTLKQDGSLRGCIGRIGPVTDLAETIASVAPESALHDFRFSPVSRQEYPRLTIEISVLFDWERTTPEKLEPGKHGGYLRYGKNSGLLLPQVALERGWDRVTFLTQLSVKAHLPDRIWQEPGAELFRFRCLHFSASVKEQTEQ